MKKSHLLGVVCACILSFVAPPTVNATTISVTSEDAGTVRNNFFVISTDSLQMMKDPVMKDPGLEDRSAAEFGLSGLGVDPINSAILTLFDGLATAPSELPVTIDIYGYSGNGVVAGSDFDPVGGMLLDSVPYNGETQLDIDVTDFINDQLANTSSFAGFNLRLLNATTSEGSVFRFDGSSGDNPPVLTLTSVPIPPALWLFGSGLLGMIGIARRNKTA